uniref:Uncharacterized protein n=1 Tax=Peronospora matthiolae TaxID=2874970 RepID=A0AAV1U8C6_9STRA
MLSSLPEEYELISLIVENAKDATLIEVKEKLLGEFGRLERKESQERALKVPIEASSEARRTQKLQRDIVKGGLI